MCQPIIAFNLPGEKLGHAKGHLMNFGTQEKSTPLHVAIDGGSIQAIYLAFCHLSYGLHHHHHMFRDLMRFKHGPFGIGVMYK